MIRNTMLMRNGLLQKTKDVMVCLQAVALAYLYDRAGMMKANTSCMASLSGLCRPDLQGTTVSSD